MFIRVAILCSSYSVLATLRFPGETCDCDVLQVEDPDGFIGYQNFSKQTQTRNGKSIYFSTQQNMIYWNENHWSYDKYNTHLNKFEWRESYSSKSFSFENMCRKKKTGLIVSDDGELVKKNVRRQQKFANSVSFKVHNYGN